MVKMLSWEKGQEQKIDLRRNSLKIRRNPSCKSNSITCLITRRNQPQNRIWTHSTKSIGNEPESKLWQRKCWTDSADRVRWEEWERWSLDAKKLWYLGRLKQFVWTRAEHLECSNWIAFTIGSSHRVDPTTSLRPTQFHHTSKLSSKLT